MVVEEIKISEEYEVFLKKEKFQDSFHVTV